MQRQANPLAFVLSSRIILSSVALSLAIHCQNSRFYKLIKALVWRAFLHLRSVTFAKQMSVSQAVNIVCDKPLLFLAHTKLCNVVKIVVIHSFQTYIIHNNLSAFDISNTTKSSGIDINVISLFEKYVNRFPNCALVSVPKC